MTKMEAMTTKTTTTKTTMKSMLLRSRMTPTKPTILPDLRPRDSLRAAGTLLPAGHHRCEPGVPLSTPSALSTSQPMPMTRSTRTDAADIEDEDEDEDEDDDDDDDFEDTDCEEADEDSVTVTTCRFAAGAPVVAKAGGALADFGGSSRTQVFHRRCRYHCYRCRCHRRRCYRYYRCCCRRHRRCCCYCCAIGAGIVNRIGYLLRTAVSQEELIRSTRNTMKKMTTTLNQPTAPPTLTQSLRFLTFGQSPGSLLPCPPLSQQFLGWTRR